MKNCTPDLRAKPLGTEDVTSTFKNMKFVLRHNLTCLSEYFEKN